MDFYYIIYIVFFSLLVQVSYTIQAKQIFGVLCGGVVRNA